MSERSAKVSRSWCLAGLLILVAMQGTAVWAATPISACNTMINQPGDYILTKDLQCPGNGVLVFASHVTLNLNGHNIEGKRPYGAVGITVMVASEVTILGPSTISNFVTGILFVGVDHSSVRMVTSSENVSQGFSFENFHQRLSQVNTFENNTAAFNRRTGFDIAGGEQNTFENNTATFNQGAGFGIGNAKQNTFRANVSTGSRYGFYLTPGAHENRLEGNTARFNSVAGIITLMDATGNVIRGNTARDNALDLDEENTNCDNVWEDNSFGTANKPCIH
jgi:parallel beta-helix repeat protein